MRYRLSIFTLLMIGLLATAAGSSIQAQDTGDPLRVVASHSILGDVIAVVAGDAADVQTLMPRRADPHSFVPTPSDLTTIADADVVFVNGALFEEGLLEAIENAGSEVNLVAASACVPIRAYDAGEHDHEDDHSSEADHEDDHSSEADHEDDHSNEAPQTMTLADRCAEHDAELEALHESDEDAEHSDEHSDESGDDHDHSTGETLGALYTLDCGDNPTAETDAASDDDHDHGACDPHVWTDPHNVMYWTLLIRDTLSEMDADNASTYRANADAYITELDTLVHEFIEPLLEVIPEDERLLVTNHDAFGYFAAAYDFQIIGTVISGGGTLAEPSAADVARLIDLVRETGTPAIFTESTVNDSLAQQIAAETGADIYLLYSGSLSAEDEPASTYLEFIRYNVTTIANAFGSTIGEN